MAVPGIPQQGQNRPSTSRRVGPERRGLDRARHGEERRLEDVELVDLFVRRPPQAPRNGSAADHGRGARRARAGCRTFESASISTGKSAGQDDRRGRHGTRDRARAPPHRCRRRDLRRHSCLTLVGTSADPVLDHPTRLGVNYAAHSNAISTGRGSVPKDSRDLRVQILRGQGSDRVHRRGRGAPGPQRLRQEQRRGRHEVGPRRAVLEVAARGEHART